jgi:hypothetical protein
MAGELNTEINQLKIIVANKQDALNRLKELLSLAEIINAGDVTPELKAAILAVYQAVSH